MIPDFLELDEIHTFFDTDNSIFSYFKIADIFKKCRIVNEENKNEESVKKLQYEIECFSFMLNDGKLKPMAVLYDPQIGEVIFPNIKNISEEALDYYEQRLTSEKNSFLKVRYAHLLWESTRKNGKFAQIAINEYLKLISILKEEDKKDSNLNITEELISFSIASYSLAIISNSYKNIVKNEFLGLIKYDNAKDKQKYRLRMSLINYALTHKKEFSGLEFIEFRTICDISGQELYILKIFHFAISFYELGLKIERKTGKDIASWINKIGECHESQMNDALNNHNYFAALSFCTDAIQQYTLTKNTAKLNELFSIFDELKNKQEFTEFSQTVNLKETVEIYQKWITEIIKNPAEDIIEFLVNSENHLLPDSKYISDFSSNLDMEYPLSSLFSTTVIDANNNPAKHLIKKEDIAQYHFHEQYKLHLESSNRIFIKILFYECIRQDKIKLHDICEYLKKYSWLGKPLPQKLINDKIVEYLWLDMISPALNEYYYQVSLYIIDPSHNPSFILSIDSLILKIEGILRDFLKHNNTITTIKNQDGSFQEKDINQLLHEQKLYNFFSEDEVEFFKFVLIEKGGYNLRHNVAHSLMKPWNYSWDYMNYLILIILRIGKYQLQKSEKE